MTVLNFSYAEIKDAEKFQEYVKKAALLMAEAGVEVLVRGNFSENLRGKSCAPHIAAVFRYSSRAAVDDFYGSEQYKALTPLRDEACEMSIHLYDE